MRLSNIAFSVMVILSAVGFVTCVVVIHELSHWQDFHGIVSDDEIYLFSVGGNFTSFSSWAMTPFAKYSYDISEDKISEKERIDSYTEYKAYGIMGVMLVFYMIAQTLVVNRWYNDKV